MVLVPSVLCVRGKLLDLLSELVNKCFSVWTSNLSDFKKASHKGAVWTNLVMYLTSSYCFIKVSESSGRQLDTTSKYH